MGEYSTQGSAATFIKSMIELLAGVPSVIYGFCGLFLLAPIGKNLGDELGGRPPYGLGIHRFLVLSIMIYPITDLDWTRGDQSCSFGSEEAAPLARSNPLRGDTKDAFFPAGSGIVEVNSSLTRRALGRNHGRKQWSSETRISFRSIFSPQTHLASCHCQRNHRKRHGSLYLQA